mmetsp:Transcript_26220/g.38002  ORF Transcript_26220/g.38002 Transcript_26220/m.38002 type:complete len:762 (-) Transcript_26220:105-2390(-)
MNTNKSQSCSSLQNTLRQSNATRKMNQLSRHGHKLLRTSCGMMGFIFISCLVVLRICIASGATVVPSSYSFNPLLLDLTQSLRDTPFSKELEAAASSSRSCVSQSYVWNMHRINEMPSGTYEYLSKNYVTLMPFIYKIYIDRSEEGEYFGTNGAQTGELLYRHVLAEDFWRSNIVSTEDVLLLGAHGSMLKERNKVIPTIKLMWPSMSETQVNDLFEDIQGLINGIPLTFDNPLLSLNALAAPGGDILGNGVIFPAAIVMGDGIIDKLLDMGLGANGPDFVHAHEYAHQVQFDLGVYNDANAPPSPIDTRDKELMADAFSAYFLSHDNGGNMSTPEILELHKTAFTIGDCNFESKNHHGTPSQRSCASMWGAMQAINGNERRNVLRGRKLDDTTTTTTVMSPTLLRESFDSALHDIVSLNPDICPFPEENDSGECIAEMVPIIVKLKLDGFAAETMWSIKSKTDGTTYMAKSYSKVNDFTHVSHYVCVHPDKEYEFYILDTFGDGILDGFYSIHNGTTGSLLVEGLGDFGRSISVPFSLSLCPGMMPITINIQLDFFAVETSWAIKAADGVEYKRTSYGVDDKETNVIETVCVHLEKEYTFSIWDSYGDGIQKGYFKIFNGTSIEDETALLAEGDGESIRKSAEVQFSPTLCPNKVLITLAFQLDYYSVETSWSIKPNVPDGEEIASKRYKVEDRKKFVTELVCIQRGEEHILHVLDTYGDGIINGGGFKAFIGQSVEDEDNLIFERNGNFGRSTSVIFSV